VSAYYNEIDPFAAAWLRELIGAGLIADGTVDERDIRDVAPDDLAGFVQCHFFAGIGVWSYALRRAGWPDERPVWTGSCPCQPFSAAGKRGGTDDERHLWPAWFHLIAQQRPAIVFGEQVASKDGLGWLDLVHADLEGADYAIGAADLCAAGVGSPHIRQRLWFVAERLADTGHVLGAARAARREQQSGAPIIEGPAGNIAAGFVAHSGGQGLPLGSLADDGRGVVRDEGPTVATGFLSGRLADAYGGHASAERQQRGWEQRQQPEDGGAGGLADTSSEGWRSERANGDPADGVEALRTGEAESRRRGSIGRPGPVNGIWRDADWLFCRDGKWRPVEPSTFPLAHGAPARVGRLRGYGNAIVASAATTFIQSYLEVREAA